MNSVEDREWEKKPNFRESSERGKEQNNLPLVVPKLSPYAVAVAGNQSIAAASQAVNREEEEEEENKWRARRRRRRRRKE